MQQHHKKVKNDMLHLILKIDWTIIKINNKKYILVYYGICLMKNGNNLVIDFHHNLKKENY